jgi:hypothetical protein
MMKGEAPQLAPIDVPTCIRWAERDPLFPYAWTDRLNETFSDLDLARFPAPTSRIARTPIAPQPRSRRFSRASTTADRLKRKIEGGTARRGKNRRSRVASLKLWPGSAASPTSLSDDMTVAIREAAATRSRF